MPITSHAARLVLGLVTPAAILVAAPLLAGIAFGMGGCTTEETTQVGSVVGVPQSNSHPSLVTARHSDQRVQVAGRGFGAVETRTLAEAVGLTPGLRSGSMGSQGSAGDTGGLLGGATGGDWSVVRSSPCPHDMASIDGRFCVDRYEASLVEVLPDGREQPFSPYESVNGHVVRAVSERGVYPQGYISEVQASQACKQSGKRLCKAKEWRQACMGPEHKTYGYGDKSEPRRCNDHGRSPMAALFPGEDLSNQDAWNWERMNRPELNQVDGTLAHTGEHDECTNGYGVYDMVGNLHEWVDDPKGAFQGGYYQDTRLNGEGCHYVTLAHEARYHDYSTGFRCCADAAQ